MEMSALLHQKPKWPHKNVIKNGQDKTANLPNLAKCEPEECCVAIFQAQN